MLVMENHFSYIPTAVHPGLLVGEASSGKVLGDEWKATWEPLTSLARDYSLVI